MANVLSDRFTEYCYIYSSEYFLTYFSRAITVGMKNDAKRSGGGGWGSFGPLRPSDLGSCDGYNNKIWWVGTAYVGTLFCEISMIVGQYLQGQMRSNKAKFVILHCSRSFGLTREI